MTTKSRSNTMTWLPGLILVGVILVGLTFAAGGPSIVFHYLF